MSNNKVSIGQWLVLAGGLIVGGIVGILLLKALATLIAFAAGGLLGLIVASIAVFGVRKTKEHAKTATAAAKSAAESVAQRYNPDRELRLALDKLSDVNERLRTTTGVSAEVLAETESLIDKLALLLEKLYGTYPSDQTTWNIASIATSHLPALAERYLVVQEATRAQAQAEVLSALQALSAEVTNLTTLIDTNNLDEARAKAEAIRSRFGS